MMLSKGNMNLFVYCYSISIFALGNILTIKKKIQPHPNKVEVMNVNVIKKNYFKFIWKIFYEISIFTIIKITTFYTIHSLVNTTGQAKIYVYICSYILP